MNWLRWHVLQLIAVVVAVLALGLYMRGPISAHGQADAASSGPHILPPAPQVSPTSPEGNDPVLDTSASPKVQMQPSAPAGFVDLAPMLTAAERNGVVSDGTFVYSIGGERWTGTQYLVHDQTQRYDPVSNSYTALAPLPSSWEDQDACFMNGRIYVPGGATHVYIPPISNTLYIYTIATNSWSTGPAVPGTPAVYYSSVCDATANKLYVIGGHTGTTPGITDTKIFDAGANTWSSGAPLPAPRFGHAGVLLNGGIYIISGAVNNAVSRTVLRYDIAANSWTSLAPVNIGGVYGGAAVYNGQIYLSGGSDGTPSSFFNRTERYDPGANAWTIIDSLLVPVRHIHVAFVGNQLYALGGATAAGTDTRCPGNGTSPGLCDHTQQLTVLSSGPTATSIATSTGAPASATPTSTPVATSTSSATSTSTPTSSVVPTVTSTATPTATPTAAAALLFSDGFESGDFTRWSGTANGTTAGAKLEVVSSAAYTGGWGAHLTNGVGGQAASGPNVWVDVPAPASQVLAAQVRIKVNTATGTGTFRVMHLRDVARNQSVLRVRYSNGAWQLFLVRKDGTTTSTNFTAPLVTGTWQLLEITYDTSGAQPVGRAYVDGVQRAALIDTSTGANYAPNRVYLLVYEDAATATGDVAFDDAKVGSSYIGGATSTPTRTPTGTVTATATSTLLPTNTPTTIATSTATATLPPSATATDTPLPTATSTPTATATPTAVPTNTPLPSDTPTPSPPANTATPTASDTPSPSPTPSATATDVPLPTSTGTPTATASPTSTPTSSDTPTSTATASLTSTVTATATLPPTDTASPTNTATPTSTDTALPTNTSTPLPTDTALPTNTATPPPTDTVLPTNTATPTATPTNSPTSLPTTTATGTPSATNTATSTTVPTSTPTSSPTATATSTPTSSPTATSAPAATATATATPGRTLLFYDGFESGDFSAWTGTANGTVAGSKLEVVSSAAYTGTVGAHLNNGGGGLAGSGPNAWADFATPAGHFVSAQVRIKVNTATGAGTFRVLQLRDVARNQALARVRYSNGAWQLFLVRKDGTTTSTNFTTKLRVGAWQVLEMTYDWSGTQPVARAYVDGVQQAALADSSTGTNYTPNRVFCMAYEDVITASADVYFDEVKVGSSYIGP